MKFKSPRSLESWLFFAGATLLILMGLLWGIAAILASHEHSQSANGRDLGVAGIWLAFNVPISVLEFAGLSCLILSALVSVFRTLLPSKSK